MAEVLSKSGLISFSNSGRHHHGRGVSVNPRSRRYNSSVSFPVKRSPSLKLKYQVTSSARSSALPESEFNGKKLVFEANKGTPRRRNSLVRSSTEAQGNLQMALTIGKAQNWWEKGLHPNMRELTSAQDLVDSLLNAGDKLVIVDFFSPGCGGCKALHPKICQLAEMNPDVQFLQVNYEEHKSMCYSLNVHVLPFFRFYRGAHGCLCSFSCTNATIKKFQDALAKHTADRCSLGPARGLEEKELLALAANKDLSFSYTPKPAQPVHTPAQEEALTEAPLAPLSSEPLPSPSLNSKSSEDSKEKTQVTGATSVSRVRKRHGSFKKLCCFCLAS